jgi:hypothetical protein
MSTLAIILVVVVGVWILLLAGGLLASRRHHGAREGEAARNITKADRALEHARAGDKGWDRAALEEAARSAIETRRPGWFYDDLALVLVDDRPGIEQDRAHFVASSHGESVRVILARTDAGWSVEQIDD